MARIPDDKIDDVRDATDLVELISRYLPLRRSGGTYKASCPFHREKTPSFTVWPETQTWKCFGCGRGGGVFQFVMERDRLTFPEAVRALAREAGIELGPIDPEEAAEAGRRARLLEVMEWAARFFEATLRSPAGRTAVEYCKRRGIKGVTAKRFRLGYVPEGRRHLMDAAARKGFGSDLLLAAGLIRPGRGEPYDWFRGRLMFPIQDVRGRVIAFGGRTLGDDEPKYLNSPDTALFKKGRTLYGLNHAREEVLREGRLGLVEGYTDVIMAHQHGIAWLVAALGTGLTREHAGLIRRYAKRVDLVFDADEAGSRAAERAFDAFLRYDVDVRVVHLPGGLDPCDILRKEGKEAFLSVIGKGEQVFEFLLARAAADHDLETVAGRIAAVDRMLSSVARIENVVKRDLLVRRLAEEFRVSEAAVRDRLKLFSGRKDFVEVGPTPAATFRVGEAEERLILEAVVFRPPLADRLREVWPPERFRHPPYRAIAEALLARSGESRGSAPAADGSFDPAALMARLPDPAAAEALSGILVDGDGKADFERQFEDCVARLDLRRRVAETGDALERARSGGDGEETRRLERELFRLKARLR